MSPIYEFETQSYEGLRISEEIIIKKYEAPLFGDVLTMVGPTLALPGSKVGDTATNLIRRTLGPIVCSLQNTPNQSSDSMVFSTRLATELSELYFCSGNSTARSQTTCELRLAGCPMKYR